MRRWRCAVSGVRAILQRRRRRNFATRASSSSSTTPAPRWVRVPDLRAAVRDVPGARRPPDQPPQAADEEEAAAMVNKESPRWPVAHACATCGLRFSSGQALGGHMRRHRRRRANSLDDCADLDLKHIVTQHERPSSAASMQLLTLVGKIRKLKPQESDISLLS
ncbi:hypothetical protein EJB05_53368, partial [Eragrostis curvula]